MSVYNYMPPIVKIERTTYLENAFSNGPRTLDLVTSDDFLIDCRAGLHSLITSGELNSNTVYKLQKHLQLIERLLKI